MQPNATPPAPPPMGPTSQGGADPYYFLQNAPAPPKKSILPSGNSKMARIIIVGVGLLALIIAAMVVNSILNNAGKENTVDLIEAAKQQTELIRITELGLAKSTDKTTKNLAITTKLSLTTDQPALLKAIAASGTKIGAKELASSKNTKTDAALNQAFQDNRFDDVFYQILVKQLGLYQSALKKAYDGASGKKLKDALNVDYVHINLILGNQKK